LNPAHEAAPIAHVGADEVRGLPGPAHESLRPGDRSARIVHRRVGPIGDASRRLPRREQYAELPRAEHLRLGPMGQCADERDKQQHSCEVDHTGWQRPQVVGVSQQSEGSHT